MAGRRSARWNRVATTPTAGSGGGGISDGDKGDIVVSGDGSVMTIDSAVVTNAKLANMAASSIKGNNTGGAAAPLDLTVAQTKTLLAIAAGDVTGLAAVASSGSAADLGTGTLPIARVADGAVTNAKLADMATQTIKGRNTAGTGVPEDLTIAQLKTLLGIDYRYEWVWFGVATVTAGTTGRYLSTPGMANTPAATTIPSIATPYTGEIDLVYYVVAQAHTSSTVEIRPRISGVNTDINMDISSGTVKSLFAPASPPAVTQGLLLACMVDHNGATDLLRCTVGMRIKYAG